ncbi:MAG: ChaN family lipoprotein [Terriglobales bacterium]
MGPTATLRFRRTAAQWHALARVQREIRATDPHGRRKYLRDFTSAFRSYQGVLTREQLDAQLASADVLLVGDYHALPASQQFAAALVEQLARQKPVVLGLEMVFARDQDILDDWRRGEIDVAELRERIRFDLDWGYEWAPFYALLEAGRRHAAATYGLDCVPRDDLRRITVRDGHAATKIAEARERHPDAAIVVVFGESHLAPNHLPELLRARRPQDRVLTVLQNVDELYWLAAGERSERVEAVRVTDDVVCVFNATPLEKYESYRLCLERWRREPAAAPDVAPSFYNMVDALLRFLNIDKYSPSNSTQPRFLVDQLPEVYYRPTGERVRRLLLRKGAGDAEAQSVLAHLERQGCCYVPRARALLVREFQVALASEEAARFVHRACCGEVSGATAEDEFYTRALEAALAYFGSRALYPARSAVREVDLYALYSWTREDVERFAICSYGEFMQLIDFLVLHKDYEARLRHYRERPAILAEGVNCSDEKLAFATRQLGYMLGSELYDAYLSGRVAKRFIRSLFFRKLKPGAARTAYFVTQRSLRRRKRVA